MTDNLTQHVSRVSGILATAGLAPSTIAKVIIAQGAVALGFATPFDEEHKSVVADLAAASAEELRTLGRELAAASPPVRLDAVLWLLRADARRRAHGIPLTDDVLCDHVACLIGDYRSVRFAFDAALVPALRYAVTRRGRASDALTFAPMSGEARLYAKALAVLIETPLDIDPRSPFDHEERSEVIVTVPPFGLRTETESLSADIRYMLGDVVAGHVQMEVAALADVVVNARGVGLCVNTEGFLTRSSRAEAQLRERLIEEGRLRAIASLPLGIWTDAPTLGSSLVMVGPRGRADRFRFVDATAEPFARPRRRSAVALRSDGPLPAAMMGEAMEAGVTDLDAREIAAADYALSPHRFLTLQRQEGFVRWLDRHRTVRLEEAAELIRPAALNRNAVGAHALREASPADVLPSGELGVPTKRRELDAEYAEKADRQRLLSGDLVLSFKGVIGTVGFVPPEADDADEPWIANQSLMIVRPKRGGAVSGKVLFQYLASGLVHSHLTALARGTTVPMLSAKDLRRLDIPVPPSPEQARIEAEFARIQKRYRIARLAAEAADKDRQVSWPTRSGDLFAAEA